MRLFRRSPLSRRSASRRAIPKLELLEDRMLPTANPLFGDFQSALGLLDIHGSGANSLVTASLSATGFVQVSVGDQTASSDPHAAAYDPALAGATGQTLTAIQLSGSPGLDHLILGNLSVAGGLSVQSDGVLDVQGQVRAAGSIQLDGQSVLLGGQVRADGSIGGDITVSAGSVWQSGLLEADGSQGNGGSIQVDVTGHYVATASSVTAANSTGTGGGGLVVIDGFSTGTLFSSGNYQANGGQGGEIDLFGQQVQLVGANINASGTNGGGWVRVGGDSPSDIAAHGSSAAGVSYADTTTVDATTTLTADALSAGNGGRIVVWSQNTTTFGGTLAAQGAGATGTGGLLEVSSAGQLTYGGHANATASSGKQGRLLLDPKNLTISADVGLPQFNLVNPSPNSSDSFGASIVRLSNGNVVVTDSTASSGAGAVYLYDGQTGALLGTLTGSTSGDHVGSGGITVLNNGNFVVSSPSWQNGGAAVGAATWIDGSTGFTASVSDANSLIGSTSGDQVGNTVTALANGNYVVASPGWHNAGAMVGAVTWGDGVNGTFGAVTASNSLVGSTDGDMVGSDGVTALTNGNYVVSSPSWQNPNGSFGAATWGNGSTGTVGPVSAANSLVGAFSYSGDVGTNVTALSDGNYVVSSPGWNADAAFSSVGAATWGNGSTGTVDVVSASNSLVGTTGTFDSVAGGGVIALTNGNYVVSSPDWLSGSAMVGAVTWGAAGGGTVGTVSASNSLVGSTDGDQVGSGGVSALSNGSYVVSSPSWQIGSDDVGAVTWAAADGTTVGPVTTSNSLVGATAGDQVGSGGVTVLSNGAYVVSSPFWQNAGNDVGAVTWSLANGTIVGPVTTSNSLVGATAGDQVGSGGVTALNNGNYVVSSPFWQTSPGVDVGAVTLAQADGSTTGIVTAGNSLVGSTNGDDVGSGGVTTLSNGNYLISSPVWQQQIGHPLGAVTWCNGSTGQTIDGTGTINAILIGPGSPASLARVLGLSGDTSFLAGFTGNGGAVTLVQLAPQSETFATAASAALTMSPSFLTATLDTGTAVVLQASNDITVSSNIVVDNPIGNGGDLTLQAGRNIFINASITTDNGNLTLIANDTAADGVVDSQRGTGTAQITMLAGTTLNAGAGNVTITEDTGAGNTNHASDDLTLADIIGNNITLLNYGLGDGSIGGVSPGGGVDMGSLTATGNLTVYSTLDIGYAGAPTPTEPDIVNVAGTTSLTTTGNPLGVILLNNHANIFGNTVTYGDPGQDVEIAAAGNLTLASATTASTLTLAAGGILTSTGPLAASGASALSGATITLTDPQNNFQGLLNLNSAGAISLTNSSPFSYGVPTGELTLAGPTSLTAPSLTLIGTLNVGAETLTLTSASAADLNGAITLAGGTISDSAGLDVGSGASLSGSGTLQVGAGAAGVVLQPTATLAPDPAGNALTVNGDLTLSATSILSEQIQSGTDFSQLNVNGAINLGNATLQVAYLNQYQPAAFDQFQVLNNGPGTAITGTFAQGSSLTVGNTILTIVYDGGASNNVVLFVQGPQANVNSLPSFSSPSFAVSWTGMEYANGAGITTFNVYVSDDNGPFTLWQSDTAQTSATFTGQLGHTYGFYGVFTDNAANLAPGAEVAQASTLTVTGYTKTATENENGTPTAVGISATLLATHYSDPDGNAYTKPGIAVFQAMGNGTWQYSTNGKTWSAITNVSQTQALLLPASDSLRFVPTTNFSGQASLNFVGWDGSQGKAGSTASIAVSGGTTPFSIDGGTLAVTVNPAPIWIGTGAALTSILPGSYSLTNPTTPAGSSVASVFGAYFHDDNPAVLSVGIAVNAVSGPTSGTWQYLTTVANATWANFPLVSPTNVLLLSANDMIRFVPRSTFVGAATLNALAWDGSARPDATTVPPASLASSVFSKTTLTAVEWVNRAPTLSLTPITAAPVPQYATGAAFTVASLLPKAGYADADGKTAPQGIAVTGTAPNGGFFQYLLAGGAWQTLPNVSASAALLLPSTASLRLVAGSQFGPATLTFQGWDQSQGVAGQTFNIASSGGASAFSTASTMLSITVTTSTNRAPTLGTPGFPAAAATVSTTNSPITVSSLLAQAHYADQDGPKPQGIAVTGAAAAGGAFQYLLAGGTWQAMPSVSSSSALLLPSTASVRLVAGSLLGTALLTFDGWDQTQGSAGQLFNIATSGGATAFSPTSAVASIRVGQAPAWSATSGAALTALPPGSNNVSPAGNTIAAVFGNFFVDGNLPVGVAVSGISGNGTWQYSTTNGSSWANFTPTPSKANAFLLSATDLIRFVPRTTAAGTGTLTAYAWDGSVGTHGTPPVNLNQLGTGGASAFSATTLTAISAFNTAPTLATTNVTLTSENENVATAVTAVTLLTRAGYGDVDGKTVSGIAVTGETGDPGAGTWQWLNGKVWTALPSVSSSSAFLLPSTAQVRFLPTDDLATNTNSSASLTYLGWDQTAGVADTTFALAGEGGVTAFSTASATASMLVDFVRQAPIWLSGVSASFTPVLSYSTPLNPTPNPAGDTVGAVFGSAFHDAAGATVGIAISAQNTMSAGSWQYFANGTWNTFPTTLSKAAPLELSASVKIRFLPTTTKSFSGTVSLTVYAWDGTTGAASLSATPLTATCLVNTAPTLT